MTRINVSNSWRMMHTDTTFKMTFSEKADTNKALEAIKTAITAINYENGYAELWLQDLSDSRTNSSFEINSTLWSYEFAQYIPAMLKAVAEALPTVSFNGFAVHDSLKCFYVDEFEFSFDGNNLHIKETFMDDESGYFCPKCGCFVAYPYEEFESEEIQCEDCEETIKVADLKYVAPTVTEETIIIM